MCNFSKTSDILFSGTLSAAEISAIVEVRYPLSSSRSVIYAAIILSLSLLHMKLAEVNAAISLLPTPSDLLRNKKNQMF